MNKLVAVVILNWNGAADTIECLESFRAVRQPEHRIIVVDNGSTDGSAEKIESWAAGKGLPLAVIRTGSNLGFARGNNFGLRYALEKFDPQYIMALNNDTVVEPDFLQRLVDCLEKDQRAGLAAPRVLDYQQRGFWLRPIPKRLNLISYLLFATPLYRYFSPLIKIDPEKPSYIYEAPGCALFFRRKALIDIGLFDENTFLGWEEFIVAEKLDRLGWRSLIVPQSRIYHKTGRSTNKFPSQEKIKLFLESEKYYQTAIMKYNWPFRAVVRTVRTIIYAVMSIGRGR
jgi:GT2 family glycosyltransferase